MQNLYIDFDGVIMDTINVTYKELKDLEISDNDQIQKYYKDINWEDLLKRTPQINDSFNCIQKIIDTNIFDVAILTHVNSLKEAVDKIHHIRKYLKHITVIPVPKIISKTKIVNAENAILVDDYCENLRQWEKAGGVGIRFSTKLNGKGFKVVDRLDQILDIYKISS